MENILKNKKIIFICVIIIFIFTLIYYLVSNDYFDKENNTNEEYTYLKNYSANEFIPIYMTESDIVSKYLNDFKNNMINNINEAYNSLNENYRNAKFGSLENFISYVDDYMSLALYSLEVDRYSVSTIDGYKYFRIYDKNDKYYIFKEISIMDYEVYLDDYTVELK